MLKSYEIVCDACETVFITKDRVKIAFEFTVGPYSNPRSPFGGLEVDLCSVCRKPFERIDEQRKAEIADQWKDKVVQRET